VSPAASGWTGESEHAEVAYFSDDFWTTSEGRAATVSLFALPDLRWFHSFSAGIDHPAFGALLERGVMLTNSSGSSSVPIAEYVLGMMLRVTKRMDAWTAAQQERRWEGLETEELSGKTAGIVGLGHIGSQVARLAKAFGMHVIGCRRSRRAVRYVDEIVPPEGLPALLAASDFVVLAVPLSPATERLIGKAELAAMRSDSWLINISRGLVVDEAALIDALERRTIAGACLDVFEHEPLPPESSLWSLSNAIVTPHNSGRSPRNVERATVIFLDNLQRYVDGRPLRNRVRPSDRGTDARN
jgi:phosphoglycerate dehydrogenase-like enzyme